MKNKLLIMTFLLSLNGFSAENNPTSECKPRKCILKTCKQHRVEVLKCETKAEKKTIAQRNRKYRQANKADFAGAVIKGLTQGFLNALFRIN